MRRRPWVLDVCAFTREMPCSCEVGSGWVLGKSATSDGKENRGGEEGRCMLN